MNRSRTPWRSRSCISRARISSNGSTTAWLSLPRHSGTPAVASAPAGPIPSPRSRSVVGQKQARVPVRARRATSSSVRWVACTAVVAGPSAPAVVQERGRGAAVGGEAGGVLVGLLGEVDVQRPVPAHSATTGRAARGTARTEWIAAPTRRQPP